MNLLAAKDTGTLHCPKPRVLLLARTTRKEKMNSNISKSSTKPPVFGIHTVFGKMQDYQNKCMCTACFHLSFWFPFHWCLLILQHFRNKHTIDKQSCWVFFCCNFDVQSCQNACWLKRHVSSHFYLNTCRSFQHPLSENTSSTKLPCRPCGSWRSWRLWGMSVPVLDQTERMDYKSWENLGSPPRVSHIDKSFLASRDTMGHTNHSLSVRQNDMKSRGLWQKRCCIGISDPWLDSNAW